MMKLRIKAIVLTGLLVVLTGCTEANTLSVGYSIEAPEQRNSSSIQHKDDESLSEAIEDILRDSTQDGHMKAEVEALWSFGWAMVDNKPFLAEQMFIHRFHVFIGDINFDGSPEILLSNAHSSRAVTATEVFVFEDGKWIPRYNLWGVFSEIFLEAGERVTIPYYINQNGERVIALTVEHTAGANVETLMEMNIDDNFRTNLLFARTTQYCGTSSRYFRHDRSINVTHDLDFAHIPDHLAISQIEYEQGVADYWNTLEPAGKLVFYYAISYWSFFDGLGDDDLQAWSFENLNKSIAETVCMVWCSIIRQKH